MVTSFNHTGIVVEDQRAMVDFYCGVLGLQELNRIESVAPPEGDHTGIPGAKRTLIFVGFEDGHRIELVKFHEPTSPPGHQEIPQLGTSHICFNVEDLEAIHSELSAKGVKFVTDPIFRDSKSGRRGIVYAQDPEGNWLEFIQ